MRKVIVCGGRDFNNRDFVFSEMDRLNRKFNFICIVQGGCPTGADKWARDWCNERQIQYAHYPIKQHEWKELGKKAGPLRNQKMLDLEHPDGCIAFPGGRGTADMIKRSHAANLPVIVLTEI